MKSLSDCGNGVALLNVPHYPENPRVKHKKSVVMWVDLYPWERLFLPSHVRMGQRLARWSPRHSLFFGRTQLLHLPASHAVRAAAWLGSSQWTETWYATSTTGPWNRPTCVSSTLSLSPLQRPNAEVPAEDPKILRGSRVTEWEELGSLVVTCDISKK